MQPHENGSPRERQFSGRAPVGARDEHPDPEYGPYTEVRQAEASNCAPEHHMHKVVTIAALFFPRTLDGRILFVCVIVSMVTPVLGGAGVLVIPVLLCMAIWAAAKRQRSLLRLTGQVIAWIFGFNLSIYAIGLIASFLALLASNGVESVSFYADNNSYLTRLIGLLMAAAIWLLTGVPQQAYNIGLDKEGRGSAQDLLVRLLTTTACVLTGAYICLLHYSVLREIPIGQLAVGMIFTVVLLAPYFKALARGCWRRGVPGVLKINEDIEKPLSSTVNEIVAARGKSGDVKATHANNEGLISLVGRFVARNWQQWFVSIVTFLVIIAVGAIVVTLVSRTSPSMPTPPAP
jgi:hypothetical protein